MSTRLARSAGLIGAATLTSRILGVVREIVLAALFGASNQMDAFNVAFRVPNLLRDLFAEGAMSAAFVPAFTRRLATESRASAWRLGNLVINALTLGTLISVAAAWLFAPALVRTLAPEFANVPGKLALTVLLTRIMLPFLATVVVSVAMMGMLNALHRFFIPALSPAMFNVATIASAFAIVPLMPHVGWPPIAGIAVGTLLGGLGQMALQWPVLRHEGWRYEPLLDWRDHGLREVLLQMAPGTLGLAAVQVNVFINTILATGQGTGAVSWLNYAFRLMYLPIGLFGISIGTAALPEISRFAAKADVEALRRTIAGALRLMLVLNVPATIGLVVLARPIVSLLLERGRFGPEDTAATAAALACYAPGLVGYSAVKIASPSFYALRDSRTPLLISVLAIVTNVVLNLTLVRFLGYRALALGTALAATLNAALLLWILRGRLGGLEGRRTIRTFMSILAASLVMAAAVWLVEWLLESALPGTRTLLRAIRVFLSIGTGVVVLAVCARLFGIAELDDVVRRVSAAARGRHV